MIKVGDKVLNKKTNMVGLVASVEYSAGHARCEHDERTAFYQLTDLEPYDGPCEPGKELETQKPAPKGAKADA